MNSSLRSTRHSIRILNETDLTVRVCISVYICRASPAGVAAYVLASTWHVVHDGDRLRSQSGSRRGPHQQARRRRARPRPLLRPSSHPNRPRALPRSRPGGGTPSLPSTPSPSRSRRAPSQPTTTAAAAATAATDATTMTTSQGTPRRRSSAPPSPPPSSPATAARAQPPRRLCALSASPCTTTGTVTPSPWTCGSPTP